MLDPEVDPLLAYLRAHGGRYSLEALRLELLAQGYGAERVTAAIAHYQRERDAGAGGEVRAPSERGIERALLCMIAGVFVLVTGTCMGWTGNPDSPDNLTSPVSCSVMVLGMALIVFSVFSILWNWARRLSRSASEKQP
jgi:Na+-transporting methylmalonyl-CoA/oxaloacetate decarboxylase gamma subunit